MPDAAAPAPYDAVLVVGFGGPEGPDDVMPFLENVLRGKNVPRERMLEVAEHYDHFGGVSPLNDQVRALLAALVASMNERGPRLPVYWGNRNWHPLLADTLAEMRDDGIGRAIALVLAAYSSYSSCRQYREDIARAQAAVGEGAPQVDKIRVFYNHPLFVEVWTERLNAALAKIPEPRRAATQIVFCAHSIPAAMAGGCQYEPQLLEACRLVGEATGRTDWKLVYQSRSGPPTHPWLGPDVCDYLRELHAAKRPADVVVAPIGFLSDHMEVIYDLDTEARGLCNELGIHLVRAATPGTHPKMVEMFRQLIEERVGDSSSSRAMGRHAIGRDGPSHDVCPEDCCPSGRPTRG
ncbi:MAG: ferrochelatase [Pirellulales bacterium]